MDYQTSLEDKEFTSDEERMKVAIELSRQNVIRSTGGPFGCAIFERNPLTGICTLFSIGVNRVVPLCNSTTHGEMVAIQMAQRKLKSYTLRCPASDINEPTKDFVMYSSCEPCAMCLGGTYWSGVKELVCSAAKEDAEAIGFQEGPVFEASYVELEKIGCIVKRNVLRAEGAQVLQDYGKTGIIYNG